MLTHSQHLCKHPVNGTATMADSEEKRTRKRNFSDAEIRILIEEVATEGPWLMSKNNAKVTNKKKEKKWEEIVEKVSACGVARREWQEVKEKFKKMRSEVINRQRDMQKTGGGKPAPPVPYEDLMLQVIGSESNLIRGISGVDVPVPVADFQATQPEPTVSSCHLPDTDMDLRSGDIDYTQEGSVIYFNLPVVSEAEQNQEQCKTVRVCSTFPANPTPLKQVPPSASGSSSHMSCAERTRKELGRLSKKRRLEKSSMSTAPAGTGSDQDMWNQYLQSEIRKNEATVRIVMEAQTVYYETITKKIKLEIEKM